MKNWITQAREAHEGPTYRQPPHMDAKAMIVRAAARLRAWHEKYGEQQPQWLPPAGDVEWLEDAAAYIAAHTLPAPSGRALPLPLALSDQDRDDLNVGAMVFRVPPYHRSEQSKRIAALMDRIAASGMPGTGRKLLDQFLTEAEKAGITHLGVVVPDRTTICKDADGTRRVKDE